MSARSDLWEQARAMYEDGPKVSMHAVAQHFGVTRGTVRYWIDVARMRKEDLPLQPRLTRRHTRVGLDTDAVKALIWSLRTPLDEAAIILETSTEALRSWLMDDRAYCQQSRRCIRCEILLGSDEDELCDFCLHMEAGGRALPVLDIYGGARLADALRSEVKAR
jgi:transposase-like protein